MQLPGGKNPGHPHVVEFLQHAAWKPQELHWLALQTHLPLTHGTFLLQLPQETVPPQPSLCDPQLKPWDEQDFGPQHRL